jgi:hypothetical protein
MKTSVILFVAGLVVVKSAGTTMRMDVWNELQFLANEHVPVVPPYKEETGELVHAEASHYIIVNCTEKHHEITTKMPFGGIVCIDNTLNVVAGRKNSVDVSRAFFKGVPLNSALMTTFADWGIPAPNCPPRPVELNFYVEVDVTFQYGVRPSFIGPVNMGTYTLRIGQGHYDGNGIGGNNWWIEGVQGTLCRPLTYDADAGDFCGITCKNEGEFSITFQANMYDGGRNRDVLVDFMPRPTSKPTLAPTSKPTTLAPTSKPTTRAPTRNSNPDCLRTHPGVETNSPDSVVAAETCRAHAAWLTANYNIEGRVFPGENTTYEDAGVDGTACTVFNYLSTTEDWCKCRCPADE